MKRRKDSFRVSGIFGKGNFFLELQDHGITGTGTWSTNSYSECRKRQDELVATNDVHYTYAEDAKPMIFYSVFRPEKAFR